MFYALMFKNPADKNPSLIMYDVNKVEESRKPYDRVKLYFEVTFLLTSPSLRFLIIRHAWAIKVE